MAYPCLTALQISVWSGHILASSFFQFLALFLSFNHTEFFFFSFLPQPLLVLPGTCFSPPQPLLADSFILSLYPVGLG